MLAVAWAPTVGQGISTDRDGTILSWNPGQVSEVNRYPMWLPALHGSSRALLVSCPADIEMCRVLGYAVKMDAVSEVFGWHEAARQKGREWVACGNYSSAA